MNETIKCIRVRDNQSHNHDDTDQRKPLLFDYHAYKDSYSLVQTRILNVAVHTWEQMHTKSLSLSYSTRLLIKSVTQNGFLPSNTLGSSLFAITSTNARLYQCRISRLVDHDLFDFRDYILS